MSFLFEKTAFLAEPCSDPSRASNECLLARSHSREICEKSLPRGDRVLSSSGTWAEVLRAQTDQRTAMSHRCADSFDVWWMSSSFALIPGTVSNIREHRWISKRTGARALIILQLGGQSGSSHHGGYGEFTHVLFASNSNESALALNNNIFSIWWLSALCTRPFTLISCLIGCILLPSKHISLLSSFPYCPIAINSPPSVMCVTSQVSCPPVPISMRWRQHWFAWFTGLLFQCFSVAALAWQL